MNARIVYTLLGAWLSLTLFPACDLLNSEEPLPMYLKIETPRVLLDSTRNLTSEIGVKDVWVDQGGQFQGVFTKGMVFPVFPGESDVYELGGGIFTSGISGQRTRYPFWGSIAQEIPFQALDTIKLSPLFRYFPRDTVLTYPFEEDFESGQPRFVSNPRSLQQPTVALNRATGEVFEGTYAGTSRFTATDSVLELVSQNEFTLPGSGQTDTWLELTFRNTIPFTAGLTYEQPGQPIGGTLDAGVFFESDDWTTVYVPLTDAVRTTGASRPVFRVWLFANGRGADGEVFIDYIRLIHFN